jgi:putative ABC transport system permease protein
MLLNCSGLGLAVYGVQLLSAFVPAVSNNFKVPIPGMDEIHIDRLVLLFTLALSFITALLCGLAPALGTSKVDLNQSLKEGGRSSTTGFHGRRFRACSSSQKWPSR